MKIGCVVRSVVGPLVMMYAYVGLLQAMVHGSNWVAATTAAPWGNRTAHDCVEYAGKLWLLGGSSSGTLRADVWSSTDGSNWTCVTSSAPWGPINGLRVLVFNNKLWVLGGESAMEYKNAVWNSTDGSNWTLVVLHAEWAGKQAFAAVVYDNKMWVMGGYGGNARDVWWSANGAQWYRATQAAPWGERAWFQAVAHRGKMWVLGSEFYGDLRDDIWSSTDGTNWTLVVEHAPWGARGQFSTITDGTAMWVIGGRDSSGLKNDVWRSEDGITWQLATANAKWVARSNHGACSYREYIWITGGSTVGGEVWYSTTGDQGIVITSAPAVLAYNDTGCRIAGTNAGDFIGDMWFSNAANGTVYVMPASLTWESPFISCEVGNNVISVYATNANQKTASTSTLIRRKAATPIGLTATDGSSTAYVGLAWLAVPGADAYRIVRHVTNDVNSAVTLANNVTTTVYTDSTAAAGVAYTYWVFARQNGVESEPSVPDTGYRQLVPAGAIAATLGASVSNVYLHWQAVPGATYYRVLRSLTDQTNHAQTLSASVTTTNYVDGSATPGVIYYYWVQARSTVAASSWSSAAPGYALLVANFADKKTWSMKDSKSTDTLVCKHLPAPWGALFDAGWRIAIVNSITGEVVSGPYELVTIKGKVWTLKNEQAQIAYSEKQNIKKGTFKAKLTYKFAGDMPRWPGVKLYAP